MNQQHAALIVHHPGFLDYDFGPWHPLRPERITAGLELLEESGLWSAEQETLTAEPAAREELALVHDPAYIRAVEDASDGWFPQEELARFGFGSGDNPPFPGMHHSASLVTGGTIQAARQIMAGHIKHAFNPSGGWHHALAARASGFCIYNDPAAAAAAVVDEFQARVLYVDFDCHHGDGVQWLFYREPNVLTISFHESGQFLFPGTGGVEEVGEGTGKGFAVNVPFAPYTGDRDWQAAVEAILPPSVEWFRPDLVISAHGADTHAWDPLTHLNLTTGAFQWQARLTHDLAHRYTDGRWLAVGSGGYDWRRVVPRSWAIVWSEMASRPLPAALPETWVTRWSAGAEGHFPRHFLDRDNGMTPISERLEFERMNLQTLEAVKRLVDRAGA